MARVEKETPDDRCLLLATPNGWKPTIMLEECALDYNIIPVDIGGGDQFKADFLQISPNNRMPAIIDHEPMGGGEPLAIFESGQSSSTSARRLASSCPPRRASATRSCSGCTGRWPTWGR